MAEKYVYSGEWHIRRSDGSPLNLNSEEGADYVLGLLEHVEDLEARLKKRARKQIQRKGKEKGDD